MNADEHEDRQTDAPAAGSAAGGFTLIEIMVVLGIAAMFVTVLAIGYANFSDSEPTTPEQVFWNATIAARKQALLSGREVRLAFAPAAASDGEDAAAGLVMSWVGHDDEPGEQRFPFKKMGEVLCEFLSTQRGVQSIMLAGELVETQTIPHMTFYGDGTCTPVRIQFRVNAGSARTLAIDPWTCAEMLMREEAK